MSMLKGSSGDFMNRDMSHFNSNNSNTDGNVKNGNDNTNNNESITFYKKDSNQDNMNKIFENWKYANSMFNINFVKGNNNNQVNMKNLNSNSLIMNGNTNKIGKSIKPHICTICQKRFARWKKNLNEKY